MRHDVFSSGDQPASREVDAGEFERLRAAIDLLPVGLLLVRSEGDGSVSVAAFNSAWEGIVGVPPPLGERLSTLPFAYYRPDRSTALRFDQLPGVLAINSGEPVPEQELHLRRPDGEWRVLMARAAPMRERGRIAGAVVVQQDVTELKRLQLEAEEGRRTLEAVMEYIPEGISIADAPDVTIRMLSRYGASLTGRGADSLVGIPVSEHTARYDIFHSDGVTRARGEELPLTRATQRGAVVKDEEWVLRTPEGRMVSILCNAGPIRDRDGAVIGGLLAWRDNTELKRIHAALREGEERFRTLAENAPDVITRFDRELRHVYVNRAAEIATRRSRDELIGKRNVELGYPADLASKWDERLLEVFRTGQPATMEFSIANAEGGRKEFETKLVPEFGPSGDVLSVLGIGREVTERRRAERALRASEARARRHAAELQTVLDAVPAAVFISRDPETRVLHGNRFSTELLRVASEQNLSQTPSTPDERPVGYRYEKDGQPIPPEALPVQRAAAGENVRDFEFDVVYSDGSVRHLFGNAVPLRSGSVIEGAVGAFVDVTELKRAEQAVRDGDRRKDEFLAVLSHELRNPLMPIRNALFLLERAQGAEQAARARATIGRQVGHLSRLVDDLLDVTRISRGKVQMKREHLELGEVVRRTVDDHRDAFARAGIELELSPTEEPLGVWGDPTRLAQAIGNLLHNAVKFTERGGSVSVTLARDGSTAVIRMRDTGIGIAPEMLERVFEPFMQAETTLARSRGGLGLGLALVKGLVELHGGTARVWSEGKGKGAEFVLELPLTAVEAQVACTPSQEAAPRHHRRVLVVEDNIDGAESLQQAVACMGHEARIARDGNEALSMVHSFRPDVVLCDIGLPGIDGYEVARRIRSDEDEGLRSTVLVALTGYALPEDQKRAHDAGFSRHIAKPPDLRSIERLLENLPAHPGA